MWKKTYDHKVTLKTGQQTNYHSHKYRNEVWIITAECGKTIVDGMEQEVTVGDVITMEAECRHTIIAKTELKLVECSLERRFMCMISKSSRWSNVREMKNSGKPFLLQPAGKDYLWGGNRLNEEFSKNMPQFPLAETWECSTHPDGQSKVASGEEKGK